MSIKKRYIGCAVAGALILAGATPAVASENDASEGPIALAAGEATVALDESTGTGAELTLGSGTDSVILGLPVSATAVSPELLSAGEAVYVDPQGITDVSVTTSPESVEVRTILNSAEAPLTYDYVLQEGTTVRAVDGGSLEILEGGTVVATVASPWAVDASGATVPTHYVTAADRFTQVIEADASTAYPVVADPKVSLGRGVYVKFTKAETKLIASKAHYISATAAMCAAIGKVHAGIKVGCGAIAVGTATSVSNTFKSANNVGKCVELRYIPAPGTPVTFILQAWEIRQC